MKLLKNLLSITSYFFNIIFLLMMVVLIVLWFNLIPDLTKVLQEDSNLTYTTQIYFFIELISSFVFLIMLNRMKLVAHNFSKKIYFSLDNAKYIKQIGWFFIFTYLLDNIISEYAFLLIENYQSFNWSEDFNIVEILLLATYKLFTGIFLLGIGKAFELGLIQKQENELMI